MNVSYEIQKTLSQGKTVNLNREYKTPDILDENGRVIKKGVVIDVKTAGYTENGSPVVTVFKAGAQVCTDGTGSLKSLSHQVTTSISDEDYTRMNAEIIPYMVYPEENNIPGNLGDLGVVLNTKTGKYTYVIYGERGPKEKLGELSYKTHLDIRTNQGEDKIIIGTKGDRTLFNGIDDDSIIYMVFHGSANRHNIYYNHIPSASEIQQKGAEELEKFVARRNVGLEG